MSASQVSVLMPSFRDHDLVERSLPRILDGTTCDLEVVVLNSDPTQAARLHSTVRSLTDARVRVVDLEQRAFARAINLGIEATTGDFVFFANSDLFVSNGYVDEMVGFFSRHARAGAATGKILRYDLGADRKTDVIDTTGHVIGRDRRVVDRGENEQDAGQYDREDQVFSVSGAALVARRAALRSIRVGGEYLDESFDMYKEDVDLCWRLRLAGWECWHVPTALAYHARTSRGLGKKTYRSAPRAFHEQQRTKASPIRINSMKNQWLMLIKNEDRPNVVRDLHRIFGREALVLGYNLVFSPRDTVRAVSRFARALPGALDRRREIKAGQKIAPSRIRPWFGAGRRHRVEQVTRLP